MKKLIEHGEYYNPYIILDRLELLFDDFAFALNISKNYSELHLNSYSHNFKSGRLLCTIRNSSVSSEEFDIKIELYKRIIFDRIHYNLEVKSNYNELVILIKNTMYSYMDYLSVETKRAIKIYELIG